MQTVLPEAAEVGFGGAEVKNFAWKLYKNINPSVIWNFTRVNNFIANLNAILKFNELFNKSNNSSALNEGRRNSYRIELQNGYNIKTKVSIKYQVSSINYQVSRIIKYPV